MAVRIALGVARAGAGKYLIVARIGMTRSAGESRMSARFDREPVVVEDTLVPGSVRGPVAGFAVRGEARRSMVWIIRGIVLRLMASVAICRRSLVNVVLVAGCTRLLSVHADQLEELVVIERGLVPVRIGRFVARFAIGREAGVPVIGIVCGIIVRFVAAVAIAWSA